MTELPGKVSDRLLRIVETAKNTGDVRKGINETTKAIERGSAKVVVIAADVEPKEIVMHLPALCDEKKIPYGYVQSKMELGRMAGLDVPSASVAVTDAGEAKSILKGVIEESGKE